MTFIFPATTILLRMDEGGIPMNQVLRNTFHGGSTQTFDSLHNFYDVCFRSHECNSTHEMYNTYCFFYGITICVFRFRIQIHSPVLEQITLRLCNELNVDLHRKKKTPIF